MNSTLGVAGATTLSNSLAVTGPATLSSTLTVAGASQLNNTLGVSGAASLGSSLAVTGASNLNSALTVAGASQINNTLGVSGAASLGNSLSVSGAASVGSTLAVTGAATFQNNVTVNGNLTVLGNTTALNTTTLQVKDSAVLLADGNTSDAIPIGVQVQYQPSGSSSLQYAGMKRRPQTGEFVFFKNSANTIENTPVSVTPSVTSYTVQWNSDGNDSFIINSSVTTPMSAAAAFTPNRAGGGAQVQGYNLPAGVYTYSASYIMDSNYYTQIVITSASQTFSNSGTSPTSIPGDILATINANAAPWQNAPGPFTGTFTLPTPMAIYAGNAENYYMGNTRVVLNLTWSPLPGASDVYAVVMADSFVAASDARLKSNVVSLEGVLDKIDLLRGVYHDWMDPSQPHERQVGVIAQEIQAVYPELVKTGGNGYLMVDYPKLTAVLLQAVKELKARALAIMKK